MKEGTSPQAAEGAFRLNPHLDRDVLRATFERHGRVQIADFLEESCAARLLEQLRARKDWVQVMNSREQVFELDRQTVASFSVEQRERLDEAVFAGAREGFQYRYQTIRAPDAADARQASADPLVAFASFLSGGEARDLLRSVTGSPAVGFADAQATAYGPGDFLTAHDDAVEGKRRIAAYVLGLTPLWRIEWGGLLLFHAIDGNVEQGLLPRFNILNLFAVPQLHSVSMVNRAAPFRRYSVTGWLRAGSPDG